MASRLITRSASPLSKAVEKILFSGRGGAPVACRSFNNSAEIRDYSDDDRSLEVHRRSDDAPVSRRRRAEDMPSFFSEAFDPFFGPPRSLSQVLNMMDQMTDGPLMASRVPVSPRRIWVAKEDNDALHLRVDMPGLGKEHVRVSVEQNTLVLKGEGDKESDDEEGVRRYSSRIDLPSDLYKMDQIRAEMKNGVLKVVVPKVKEEERKDVFQVSVE